MVDKTRNAPFVARLSASGNKKSKQATMSTRPQRNVIVLKLPAARNFIDRFDGEPKNKASRPDLLLVVDDLPRPLRLHRFVLAPLSEFVRSAITHHKQDVLEWPFDTSNPDDLDALVDVLRLCYGEKLRLTARMVCPVVAAMCRLQLDGMEPLLRDIVEFAEEIASIDINAGVSMLLKSDLYEECKNEDDCLLNQALARVVLSEWNCTNNYQAVSKCLMRLPSKYLDMASFADEHQELGARLLYVRTHEHELGKEKKKAIVRQGCSFELSAEEAIELDELGLFGNKELLDYFRWALQNASDEMKAATRNLEKAQASTKGAQRAQTRTHKMLKAAEYELEEANKEIEARKLDQKLALRSATEARFDLNVALEVLERTQDKLRGAQKEAKQAKEKLESSKKEAALAKEAYLATVQRTEAELKLTQRAAAQTKQELEAAKRELAAAHAKMEAAWQVQALVCCTKSATTDIQAGHEDAVGGGAVYDDLRRIMVSTALESDLCGGVFVVHLGDARSTAVLKKGLVPFPTASHAPVYDGTRFVYLMERSGEGHAGCRFGRLDVDTWAFEELQPLPAPKFCAVMGGCWQAGAVYAVDESTELCAYDVARGCWARCGVRVPPMHDGAGVRLLSNPHDTQHVFAMVPGSGLYALNLVDHTASLVSAPPVPFDTPRDALLVAADKNAFVVVAALAEGEWHAYNSLTHQWTKLGEWRPSGSEPTRCYLVFAPSQHAFFYHVHGTEALETVSLLPPRE